MTDKNLPVIDMHLHAHDAWVVPGIEGPHGLGGPESGDDLRRRTFAAFDQYNVVLGVASGPSVDDYRAIAPERILAGPLMFDIEIGADYSFWRFAHQDPAIALQPPACERLAEISCPALIVEGEYEIAACHQAGELLAEAVPDARTVVIAGGGHLSNADDLGAFNRAVLAFFASVAGTG